MIRGSLVSNYPTGMSRRHAIRRALPVIKRWTVFRKELFLPNSGEPTYCTFDRLLMVWKWPMAAP